MPLVDLDDPEELRARWTALAAVSHATGFDRRWYADGDGYHHQDESASVLRMVRLEDGRAVLWGFHTQHSRTAGEDLLAGSPEWIGRPEVQQRQAAGELGFVYGAYNGSWARASYPGDPWQPVDDGFAPIGQWITSDEAAADEMIEWVAEWADYLGGLDELRPYGVELIRTALDPGVSLEALAAFFAHFAIDPRSPVQPDLEAGVVAALDFTRNFAEPASFDSDPDTAEVSVVEPAVIGNPPPAEDEESYVVPPGISPFTGQPIDQDVVVGYGTDQVVGYDQAADEPGVSSAGPSTDEAPKKHGWLRRRKHDTSPDPDTGQQPPAAAQYPADPSQPPEQPPYADQPQYTGQPGQLAQSGQAGYPGQAGQYSEHQGFGDQSYAGPQSYAGAQQDPSTPGAYLPADLSGPGLPTRGPVFDQPLPSSEPPRVGGGQYEGEDFYNSLFADAPAAAAPAPEQDWETAEQSSWADQDATSEYNPFADDSSTAPRATAQEWTGPAWINGEWVEDPTTRPTPPDQSAPSADTDSAVAPTPNPAPANSAFAATPDSAPAESRFDPSAPTAPVNSPFAPPANAAPVNAVPADAAFAPSADTAPVNSPFAPVPDSAPVESQFSPSAPTAPVDSPFASSAAAAPVDSPFAPTADTAPSDSPFGPSADTAPVDSPFAPERFAGQDGEQAAGQPVEFDDDAPTAEIEAVADPAFDGSGQVPAENQSEDEEELASFTGPSPFAPAPAPAPANASPDLTSPTNASPAPTSPRGPSLDPTSPDASSLSASSPSASSPGATSAGVGSRGAATAGASGPTGAGAFSAAGLGGESVAREGPEVGPGVEADDQTAEIPAIIGLQDEAAGPSDVSAAQAEVGGGERQAEVGGERQAELGGGERRAEMGSGERRTGHGRGSEEAALGTSQQGQEHLLEGKAQVEPHPQPWPEPQPRPEPWPQPEPQPGPWPEPTPPMPGPTPEPTPAPRPGPQPGPQPGPVPGPQPVPGPEPEPVPGPEPEPMPGPEPTPRPMPEPEPMPEPFPQPEPEPLPEPEPEPQPAPAPDPWPQPHPDPEQIPPPEPQPGDVVQAAEESVGGFGAGRFAAVDPEDETPTGFVPVVGDETPTGSVPVVGDEAPTGEIAAVGFVGEYEPADRAGSEERVAPADVGVDGLVEVVAGLGGAEPRVVVEPGSLEEAMRAEVERPRPEPEESEAVRALRAWCRARTAIVPSGFTIQVQVLNPSAPSYRFDLEPPEVNDPEFAADKLSELLADLWLAEAQGEQGGWLFARIDAAGRTLRIDRWYDRVPDWWDNPVEDRLDVDGLVRRLYDRGPEWQPTYLEKLYTTAR